MTMTKRGGMTMREGNNDERGDDTTTTDTNTRPRRHSSPGYLSFFLSFLWPRGHALMLLNPETQTKGGLYCSPPKSNGLCSDTRTVLGLRLDFPQTIFG
jgi:hypothetical protein